MEGPGSAIRRFALMPGKSETTLSEVSLVAVAVVMYHGTVAKLTEIVENGQDKGRAQAIFWDVKAGRGRVNPLPWYQAAKDVLEAKYVARLVRHAVVSRGRTIVVSEFQPPLDVFRYAEIEASPDDPMTDLPPWIGREVTGDPTESVYSAVVEAYRLRRKGEEKVLP